MTESRILFVDDDANVLRSYERMLKDYRQEWEMEFFTCPLKAWQRLLELPFDVVISDVQMPVMNGLQLLNKIKQHRATTDVPVLIVTGSADRKLKHQALNLDATDLLTKPVNADELTVRIRSALRLKGYADRLKLQNQMLDALVQQRTAELEASRTDIIWRLAKAAEYRDEETGNHVIRVGSYCRIIARAMGLDEAFTERLFMAAPLHDIGKIGIPDAILLKPGKLTEEEWQVMRTHCEIGHSILTDTCKFMGVVSRHTAASAPRTLRSVDNPIIELASTIALSHHEKWDGSGYPHGLAGSNIPLAGRIVAIADVYDALRSARPYKQPLSMEQAIRILVEGSGQHFDPCVVCAFIDGYDEINAVEFELTDPVDANAEAADETPLPVLPTSPRMLASPLGVE